MKAIGFLDPAWNEMMEAARYYNQQSPNLGSRFLDSVHGLSKKVQTFPESGRVVHENVRQRLVSGWPYALLYKIEEERITIVAVSHQKRTPDYWHNRV